LHPTAMWAGLRGMLSNRRLSLTMENGVLGLPADFLIEPDGRIRAAHYGERAYDNWDVDTLLDLARCKSDAQGRSETLMPPSSSPQSQSPR
jgi:hypothetical protein